VTRRCLIEEGDVGRVADLAHDVGISLRVPVNSEGGAFFAAAGLGTFDDLLDFERALRDVARVRS
jgi:hypothetical protein